MKKRIPPSLVQFIQSDPSPHLLILNVGCTGGSGSMTQARLEAIVESLAPIQVAMPLSQPFSFLTFSQSQETLKAKDWLEKERGWCLHFLSEIPETVFPKVIQESISGCIPGLFYMEEFMSAQEEAQLLINMSECIKPWISLQYRRVVHFGSAFDYATTESNQTDLALPDWSEWILDRYQSRFPSHPRPNQLTVNQYEPGDGIGPHLDSTDVFETSPILIVSLSSPCVMEFSSNKKKIQIDLQPQSLLVMSNEARLDWTHAIRTRKIDSVNGRARPRQKRTSLTFRRTLPSPSGESCPIQC